ncbi:MAG: energy transducer TonB [Euryhalocaulis sp.]|uniref:energy transducer TonB n=1 Tax=Euryhalocaulis sp. TaxID=2744307 RepID=UPI0018148C4C|nr:energy transducer TonB [Euryhalocaulis sp.]MBA4801581.1 energy transducer TonB [Euryhalocaulis sp.]
MAYALQSTQNLWRFSKTSASLIGGAIIAAVLFVFMSSLVRHANILEESRFPPRLEFKREDQPTLRYSIYPPPQIEMIIDDRMLDIPVRPPLSEVKVQPPSNFPIWIPQFSPADLIEELAFEGVSFPLHRSHERWGTKPEYPTLAIQQGIEGVVILSFRTDASGKPVDIATVSASHSSLEQAALNALEQWRFDPEMHDEGLVTQRFEFRLHD